MSLLAADHEEEAVPAVAPVGWVVDSEERADWAACKILEAEAQVERLEVQHSVRLARARAELERAKAFFVPQLEAWAERHLPRDRKSVDLPSARLAFKTVPGGLRIQDRAACLAWAREHLPSAIVPSYTEHLDAQIVAHEASRIYGAELERQFASMAESATEAEAVAICNGATSAAEAALPPGVRNVPDELRFSVRAPARRRA